MQKSELKFAFDFATEYITTKFDVPFNDINYGWCFCWTYIVRNVLETGTYRSDISLDHAWFELDGLHYDSDTPNGAKSPYKLNTSSNYWGIKSKKYNVFLKNEEEFTCYWLERGYGKYDFEKIIENINTIKENYEKRKKAIHRKNRFGVIFPVTRTTRQPDIRILRKVGGTIMSGGIQI
jgi:hypothetical protein